jgi:hypothetical protein
MPLEKTEFMIKVYTYFSHVPNTSLEDAFKLLLLWKRNWSLRGFDPVVLNESHARQHDLYKYFERRIEVLPSINKVSYERSCYLRWAAMAVVGGGIMTDADVMCYSKFKGLTKPMPDVVHLLQRHIPSVVLGSRKAYDDAVTQMIDYKVTEKDIEEGTRLPHVSDMYMFYRGGVNYTSDETVFNYGDEGWDKANLVHFANSTLKGIKEPRHKIIPTLREF